MPKYRLSVLAAALVEFTVGVNAETEVDAVRLFMSHPSGWKIERSEPTIQQLDMDGDIVNLRITDTEELTEETRQ